MPGLAVTPEAKPAACVPLPVSAETVSNQPPKEPEPVESEETHVPGDGATPQKASKGTFAGRRPPKGPEGFQMWTEKVSTFEKTVSSLENKYPGHKMPATKSQLQLRWWKFQGEYMKKFYKGNSFQDYQVAMKKCGAAWKAELSKEMHDAKPETES